MLSNFSLEGKVVLLTGAAGFLGEHFAHKLHLAGATVVLTDIKRIGDGYEMDVTDQSSVESVLTRVVQQYGRIHVIVNNAAYNPSVDDQAKYQRKFMEYPEEAMMASVQVNQLGTWRVCKAAIPHMLVAGGGTIVNIVSVYGVTPPRQEIYSDGMEKSVDYSMTKAAVGMLTRHIASQFGRNGIRCNALAPGGVFNHQKDAGFIERYSAQTSLGRMSDAGEVADALVFLASDASRGMTGEVLNVDGGFSSR